MNEAERKKGRILFLTGSCGYPLLELLWRGKTHYSMALAGGVCLVLIDKVCCKLLRGKSLPLRCVTGSAVITGVELVTGLLFNGCFGMKVWDYSHIPFNFKGQICLPYSALWCGLTLPAMLLCEGCGRLKFLS